MVVNRINRRVERTAAGFLALVLVTAPVFAQQASEAQRNAIRQACPADYQRRCANVPAAGQAAFACLERNMASLSPPCQRAVRAVSAGVAPHGATSPSVATAPTAREPAMSAQSAAPLPLRQQLMLVRQSCSGDFHAFCSGVPLGGGRAIACLRAHAGSLSPQCGEALSAARAGR